MRLFVTVSISSEWKDEGWLSAITTTTTTTTTVTTAAATTLTPTTIKKMNNLDRAGGRRQRLRRHDLLMRVLLHLVLHVVAAAGKERKRTFKNPRYPSGGKERDKRCNKWKLFSFLDHRMTMMGPVFFSISPYYPLFHSCSFSHLCPCRLASWLEQGSQVVLHTDHLSSCCLFNTPKI